MTEKTTIAPRPAPLPAELDTGAEDSTIRPFHIDDPGGGARGPPCSHRGHALAREGDRRRSARRACSWRRCRHSRATGRPSTTGASARRELNSCPHFITEIDGLDIHFIHVRSKHEDALPLIVCHGWPGSVIEQMKIIEPLTDPTAHGASAADAFHLVIPSMPGYGFSGKPAATGWGPEHIASAWAELMKRLGYDRYVAQGGDWGGQIVDLMGVLAPPGLIGIHTNFPGAVRDDVTAAVLCRAARRRPVLMTRKRACTRSCGTSGRQTSPMPSSMGTHPQTLYGIADSPVGLAAWLLDHDATSLALIARVFDGQTEGLTRDDVLDNITHYWLTNTGISSGRLYWENKLSFFGPKGVSIPVAVSSFPDELYQAPRSWAEQAYPNLIYFNKLDKGGHFAAWEQPQLFSEEVRAGLRSLR